jgi:hypothetical protein
MGDASVPVWAAQGAISWRSSLGPALQAMLPEFPQQAERSLFVQFVIGRLRCVNFM